MRKIPPREETVKDYPPCSRSVHFVFIPNMQADSKAIRVIIFDLGGVVFSDGTPIAVERMKKVVEGYELSPRLIETLFHNELAVKHRKGLVSEKSFWGEIEPLLEKKYPLASLQELQYSSYTPQEGMLELLASLKGRTTLAVFSVIAEGRLNYLEKQYHIRSYFDIEAYSFEAHANKHEDVFYEYLIKKLPHEPSACILVDDHQHTLDKAKGFGFQTILFEDPEKFTRELEKF